MGCTKCATACHTGGEQEIRETIPRLKGEGHLVVGWTVIEAVCDRKATRRDLHGVEVDAVLSMACGAGTQVIGEVTGAPVVPALDTFFLGSRESPDCFVERCQACGSCVLGETGGICPVTRCSKGLLNGPCGGTMEGKCEVDPEQDCAWTQIYEKLRETDDLDNIRRIRGPIDHARIRKPQKLGIEEGNDGGSDPC